MSETFVSRRRVNDLEIWDRLHDKRGLASFGLEVTARCNNDCRHCYINLPSGDRNARATELTLDEIRGIADEAVSLGALWCLVTGGEPLLREDFSEIYLSLKKKGLLVSVFTNATLVRDEHVRLFREYPPQRVEVSVYGVTRETYERVTRRPGSFARFTRGLDLLLRGGVKVQLKAMALSSNLEEMQEIGRFCREKTVDGYRFDPFLHLRIDGDPERNRGIRSERLSAEEVVALERTDPKRMRSLRKMRDEFNSREVEEKDCDHLFLCQAGRHSCTVGWQGHFRLCSSLCHQDCVFDLRQGTLTDAWRSFAPRVLDLRSTHRAFRHGCKVCPLINLCLWCPAHAHLEAGELDAPVDHFCQLAHARANALGREGDAGGEAGCS